jgi:energy-coupling factor transporter ATP-binding protein EcfA2
MNPNQIVIGHALQKSGQLVVQQNGTPVAVWPYGSGDAPHCLVVGSSGSGKSTLVRWLVLNLVNDPAPKRITLIDGKGANSYLMYKGQPHVVGVANKANRFTGQTDIIPDIIRLFHEEVQHRYEAFDNAKKKAHRIFGHIDYAPPPHMWLIFDEFLDWILSLPARTQREMHKLLISIVQTAREVNCHLLIATQAPYAEALGETGLHGLVKRNLNCRIAMVGNHGLDELEAKMAFGGGHSDSGKRVAIAAARAGLFGKDRRGVGILRVGFREATFKAPWIADCFHFETSERDRIAAIQMLPRKLKAVKTDDNEETG